MPSKPERILYLEDREDLAEITTMALEMFGGHEVLRCSSAEELLERMEAFEPDLMLLDVMLPGMSGVEALKEIRRSPRYDEVPAVFLTAKAQNHEHDEYLQLGAAGVVRKPFDPMELSEVLTRFWRLARAGGARPDPEAPPAAPGAEDRSDGGAEPE